MNKIKQIFLILQLVSTSLFAQKNLDVPIFFFLKTNYTAVFSNKSTLFLGDYNFYGMGIEAGVNNLKQKNHFNYQISTSLDFMSAFQNKSFYDYYFDYGFFNLSIGYKVLKFEKSFINTGAGIRLNRGIPSSLNPTKRANGTMIFPFFLSYNILNQKNSILTFGLEYLIKTQPSYIHTNYYKPLYPELYTNYTSNLYVYASITF